ncbi:cystatin family protein [Streptomyces sioyaensis]|uniref:cystatin family protein n=1 Tax=Streptomyces sioyaensis TaxID=67364 RepID=UPI0037D3EDBB
MHTTRRFKGRAALAALCGVVLAATLSTTQAQADPAPGGWTKSDPNSPTAQEITQWAATRLNATSNSAYLNAVTQRVDLQTQVVAGTVYRTEFIWAPTNCLKNSGTPEEECSVIPGAPQELCIAKIYDRPWEHSRELTEFECNRINS